MKKNLILKFISGTFALSFLTCFSNSIFPTKAVYSNEITSPIQEVICVQNLVLNGSSQNIYGYAYIRDNEFTLSFNNNVYNPSEPKGGWADYPLYPPQPGNIYYAVFKNRLTGEIISMQQLNQNNLVTGTNTAGETVSSYLYYVTCKAPDPVNAVDVAIYQQSGSAQTFNPATSTLVGTMRFFNASNSIYTRQSNTQTTITAYDNSSTQSPITGSESYYYNRLTPNLYSILTNDAGIGGSLSGTLGVIETIEGKGGAQMSAEDKIVPLSYTTYRSYANVATGTHANPLTPKNYFNFTLPDDVTEFYFKVYKGSTTGTPVANYHIIINRSNN